MSSQQIPLIEELAANAWPPAIMQIVDGWRLRSTAGVSRRANSVWPNEHGAGVTLVDKLALVEAFYARRATPPRYQISPACRPADLDAILAGRGYGRQAPTVVQTARLATVLAQTQTRPAYPVVVREDFDDEWFAVYKDANCMDPDAARVRREIVRRIAPLTGFALLRVDGQPAAVGLGVLERGWLGVFCMATGVALRRRGAAGAVLRALAQWGERHRAAQMYLQVEEHNSAALALYAGAGLAPLYRYHYRERAPET